MVLKRNAIYGLALVLAISLTNCNKDDDEPNDCIIGEWRITEANGQPAPPDEEVELAFEADGDFAIRSTYTDPDGGVETYSYSGTWEFTNDERTEATATYTDGFGDVYELEFEFESCSDSMLSGKIDVQDNSGYGYTLDFEAERQ